VGAGETGERAVTPPEPPSSLLERAAQRVEEFARSTSPAPWGLNLFADQVRDYHQEPIAYDTGERNAAWMALMSPAVAAPLAKWLRNTARYVHFERGAVSSEENGREFFEGKYGGAFELARLILRESP
jgi:hypothetical protein